MPRRLGAPASLVRLGGAQPSYTPTNFERQARGIPGLLLYLPFGEASGAVANDDLRLDDGSYQNSPTLAQTGLSASEPGRTSVLLNGTSQSIQVGASHIPNTGDVFTWVLGVKLTATSTPASRLWDRLTSGDFQIFVSSANGGTTDHWDIEWQGGGTAMCVSTTALDTNPHLLIATKNGATIHLYQDGVDVSGAITNQTVTGATGAVMIGCHRSGGSDFFPGTIQDQLLYNRDISAAEALALWNAWGVAATTNVSANADVGQGTGAGQQPAVIVAPNAGNAAGTGAAQQPTASLKPNAGNGAATGAANQPSTALAINGQAATGTGAGQAPTANVRPSSGAGTGTGAANPASASINSNGAAATVTGAVGAPTASLFVNGGLASGTGAAFDATVSTATNTSANAQASTGTGAANAPGVSIFVNAGVATGTGAASSPSVKAAINSQAAAAIGAAFAAHAAVAPNAGNAAGTGIGRQPAAVSIAVLAALAAATGSAYDATATTPVLVVGGLGPGGGSAQSGSGTGSAVSGGPGTGTAGSPLGGASATHGH